MVSVCLPSDASRNTYRLTWVSLTLGVGYLFTAAPAKHSRCSLPWTSGCVLTATVPDLQHGIAPLDPPAPTQPLLLGYGLGPPGSCPWLRMWLLEAVPVPSQPGTLGHCSNLGHGVTPIGPHPLDMGFSQLLPLTWDVE